MNASSNRLSTPTLESGSPSFKPAIDDEKGPSSRYRKSDGLIYQAQGQTENEEALQLAEQPESSDFKHPNDAIFDETTPEAQKRKITYQNTND